jgi:hypothetical protein
VNTVLSLSVWKFWQLGWQFFYCLSEYDVLEKESAIRNSKYG